MIVLTATNPNGLDFDYATEDAVKAKGIAKRILTLGGVDLKMNGTLVPAHVLASL